MLNNLEYISFEQLRGPVEIPSLISSILYHHKKVGIFDLMTDIKNIYSYIEDGKTVDAFNYVEEKYKLKLYEVVYLTNTNSIEDVLNRILLFLELNRNVDESILESMKEIGETLGSIHFFSVYLDLLKNRFFVEFNLNFDEAFIQDVSNA